MLQINVWKLGNIRKIEFTIVNNREQPTFKECSPLSHPVQHVEPSG